MQKKMNFRQRVERLSDWRARRLAELLARDFDEDGRVSVFSFLNTLEHVEAFIELPSHTRP